MEKYGILTLFDDDEIKSESQQVKITDFLSLCNWHSMVAFMGGEQTNELWDKNEKKETHQTKKKKIEMLDWVIPFLLKGMAV